MKSDQGLKENLSFRSTANITGVHNKSNYMPTAVKEKYVASSLNFLTHQNKEGK